MVSDLRGSLPIKQTFELMLAVPGTQMIIKPCYGLLRHLTNEGVERCKGEILIKNALLLTSPHFHKPQGSCKALTTLFSMLVMHTSCLVICTNGDYLSTKKASPGLWPICPWEHQHRLTRHGWTQLSPMLRTMNSQLESKLPEPEHKHLRMMGCSHFRLTLGP